MAIRPRIGHLDLFAGAGMLGLGAHIAFPALRTVAYVEREAYAAALLVSRMQDGALDDAPVWSDVTTFPSALYRGKVGLITAGFPCQDLSCAGKRAGLDGKRSGLFFEVLRIATDCGAPWLFLENVAGIYSAGATAFSDSGERFDVRAASAVGAALAESGYDSWWLPLRASDVGASHERLRWFCLANAQRDNGGAGWTAETQGRPATAPDDAGEQLADAEGRPEGRHAGHGLEAREDSGRRSLPLHAPGPGSADWPNILEVAPDLKPALCRMADGMASRVDRLRLTGNGACPLQAAVAFRVLGYRAGFPFGEDDAA